MGLVLNVVVKVKASGTQRKRSHLGRKGSVAQVRASSSGREGEGVEAAGLLSPRPRLWNAG